MSEERRNQERRRGGCQLGKRLSDIPDTQLLQKEPSPLLPGLAFQEINLGPNKSTEVDESSHSRCMVQLLPQKCPPFFSLSRSSSSILTCQDTGQRLPGSLQNPRNALHCCALSQIPHRLKYDGPPKPPSTFLLPVHQNQGIFRIPGKESSSWSLFWKRIYHLRS